MSKYLRLNIYNRNESTIGGMCFFFFFNLLAVLIDC